MSASYGPPLDTPPRAAASTYATSRFGILRRPRPRGRGSLFALVGALAGVAATSELGCSASTSGKSGDPGAGVLSPPDGGSESGGLATETGAVGDAPSFAVVSVTPSNAVVAIDLSSGTPTPGTQTFAVRVRADDGTETDVTKSAKFTIDPKFGSFSGATFTTGIVLPDGRPQSTIFTADVTDPDGKTRQGQGVLTEIALRKSGDKRDFFFLVPYGGDPSPSKDVLKFSTNIKQVDVAFVMDTTGSMGGVISTMKSSISAVIPKLQAAIPNVGVAISGHDDFPYDGHGADPDVPFYLLQTVTTDIKAAQRATNEYPQHGGGDTPESQFEAAYQVLTGEGVNWPGGSLRKHTNAPGTYGGVDFRPGSLPVVVEITDFVYHPKSDYAIAGVLPPLPHGEDEVKDALKKTHARYVGIAVNAGGFESSFRDEKNLSEYSGAVVPPGAFKDKCGKGQCCTEETGGGRAPDSKDGKSCVLTFKVTYSSGMDDGVVSAITALSAGSNFDVTAVPSNDPANPGGVDATKFIKRIRAMDEGDPAQGCPKADAKDSLGDGVKDTFIGVTVGTPVCFEVIPAKNDKVRPTKDPQFFNAFLDVLGIPGGVKLDQRRVLFLVPPKDVVAR